jgi:hypothetical protein
MPNLETLIFVASRLDCGTQQEYELGWKVTKVDASNIALKLGQRRSGATFLVTKINDQRVRIQATEPVAGYTITKS